ncbi:MAG: N-acetylglucosamine-6-phosphate deacetylase [Candidatus Aenigmatarchaeota archaeon]
MNKIAIKVSELITPIEKLSKVYVLISSGRIEKIISWKDKIDKEYEIIDYSNYICAPGYIDIHTHGCYGYSAMDNKEGSILKISESLLKHGVTSFLPTTLSAPIDELSSVLKNITSAMKINNYGAEILGAYVEGPYISKEKAVAQNVLFVRNPNIEEFKGLLKISEKNIRVVTIAPEVPGAIEFIKNAVKNGVVVAAAHTNANYEEAIAGFNAGITLCSHFFNGMRNFHHRDPGIIGAALINPNVYCEIIADMVHLHPSTIKLTLLAKGIDKTILITDSISATGLSDGYYELEGLKIIVKNGVSRRVDTGDLAGSTLTMDKAVKNMVNEIGLSIEDAIKMATINPAKVIGEKERGFIFPGVIANLIILDEKLNVIATFIKGKKVYDKITLS